MGYALIQNHIYKNVKEKCLEKMRSFKYIQDIFDNLVQDAIGKKNDGSILWLNKPELNKLKSKELAAMIYNVRSKQMGTLLTHYRFDIQRVRFVKDYEFKVEGLESEEDKVIISEDNE